MKKPLIIVNNFLTKFLPSRAEAEPPSQEVNLQNLEERVLYDASPLGVLAQEVMDVQDVELSLDSTLDQIDELSLAYDGITEFDGADDVLASGNGISATEDLNLIVIDSRIDDYDQLIIDLQESNVHYEILELDGTTNGIEEITRRLNEGQKYEALHIIGHGEEANLQLGSADLGSHNIDQYQAQISSWRAGLTGDADILLYGCDVAGSQEGIDFVDRFNELTGADVAASSDLTGNADLGGDWEFEYNVGLVETDVVFSAQTQAEYQGVFATFTVDTLADVVDAGDGVTSLREAVIAVNDGAGGDTILLGAGVHTLSIMTGSGDEHGDLDINKDVTIIGMADGSSVIDASGLIDPLTMTGDRVFDVLNGDATFRNLTITGGDTTGLGGGISIGSSLRTVDLDNVVVTGNSAATHGGGIYSVGTLTVTNSTISNNNAGNVGGGVAAVNGAFQSNSVTVSGNNAVGDGGGFYVSNGSHDFTNVTVSGNTSGDEGGGLYVTQSGTANLNNATITDNTAVEGGGITNELPNSIVNVTNSIISLNTSGVGDNDVDGSVNSDGNSIIGDDAGLMLGALADNGGPIQTHELQAGSAGIDAAGAAAPDETDGRGYFVADPLRDLGAFERAASDVAFAVSAPLDLSSGIELNLDGGNDAFFVADDGDAVFGGLTSLTFEANLTLDSATAGGAHFFTYSVASNAFEARAFIDSSNQLLIGIGGNFVALGDVSDILDGTPHSLSVSWDNSNGDAMLFVDGEFRGSNTISAGHILGANGDLIIGQRNGPTGLVVGPELRGVIYDMRVWDEARSASEIALDYQQKIVPGTAPSSLVANWQMDGFNASNEVVDVVAGNNLSIDHATGSGFIASTPIDDLNIDENSTNGATVGYVVPTDPDGGNDIVRDGQFSEKTFPGTSFIVSSPDTFGDWEVTNNQVVIYDGGFGASPQGGRSVELGTGTGQGAISQTLDTVAGQEYQLTFAFTGDFDDGDPEKYLRVTAGAETGEFTITEPNGWTLANPVWDYRTITFVATGPTTTLSFESFNLSGTGHSIIADVAVVEVPSAISAILANDPSLTYDAATDKFYKENLAFLNWVDAQTFAGNSTLNGVDGQLAVISSQHENDVVRSVGPVGSLWIGASDQTTEGNWHWYEGAVQNDDALFWTGDESGGPAAGFFTNWRSTVGVAEPSAGAPGDDFALIDNAGEWLNADSTALYRSVIEWDASEVLSNYTFDLTDDANGRFEIDSNTGEITVADGLQLDHETNTTHVVDVEVTDAGGNTYLESMTIEVNNVLELDVTQVVPGPQTIAEDTPLTFIQGTATEVSVGDSSSSIDSQMRVTLSVNDGVLNLSQTTNLVIAGGADGSSLIVIDGAESDINAALDGMTFTPDSDFNGSVTLDMTTELSSDLEGHYTFDGGNADDQSAGANDGTLIGGATIVTDPERAEVLSLNGGGDMVEIPGVFDQPADVTLAAWVNLTSADIYGSEVISLGNSVQLRVDGNGDGSEGISLAFWNGSNWLSVNSHVFIANEGWHHVAASFDDSNNVQTVYLNGEVIATDTQSQSIVYGLGSNTTIGSHGDGDGNWDFDGLIDEARVYDRALSADEVLAIAGDLPDLQSTSDSVAITVDPVNDAPDLDNSGLNTLTAIDEDNKTSAGDTIADIIASAVGNPDSITDPDADAVEGVAIFNTDTTNGNWEYSLDGTSWIDFGNPSSSAALLLSDAAEVRFVPDGDFNGDVFFSFKAWDQTVGVEGGTIVMGGNSGGTNTLSDRIDTAWITVNAVNDAPTVTNNGATTNEGDYLTLTPSMLQGNDVDDAAADLDYTISNIVNGQFEIRGSLGVPITSFTQAQIDAGDIVFLHDGSETTTASFDFSLADGGEDGAMPATGTFNFTVTPVNDAPESIGIGQGGPEDITLGITISGTDADGTVTDFRIINLPANGTLYSDSALTNPVAANSIINATAGALNLWFEPTLDWNGTTSFNFAAIDNEGLEDATPATKSMSFSAVNDAPELDSFGPMTLSTITEDDVNNNGDLVSDIILSAGGDRITDADSGALEGIAVVVANQNDGHLEYSLDNGATWTTVGAVSEGDALLLRDTDRLRFVPNEENGTNLSMFIRAWDQTTGAAGDKVDLTAATRTGGTTAFSVAADQVLMSVTDVNDAPDGIDKTITAAEDGVYSFVPGTFGLTDVDNNAFQSVIITTVPTVGTLELSGIVVTPGQELTIADIPNLLYVAAPDTNGAGIDNFTFQVRDDGGTANGGVDLDPTPNTIIVNVNAQNDAPVLDNTGLNTLTAIGEDNVNSVGDSVADILASGAGNPDPVYDIDTGAVEGIAVYYADTTNGDWEYSTDGGTNWTGFGNPTATAALLLSDAAQVRFVPNADFNGTANFSYKAWDQTTGTEGNTLPLAGNSGGTNTLSDEIDTAQITVSAVNDTPFASSPATMNSTEQMGLSLLNAGFTIGDIDSGSSDIQVVFAASEGTVVASMGNSGVTVSNTPGSTTITGTLAEITNLLAGTTTGLVTYNNTLDAPSATATVTMTVNDLGNTGADPGLTGDGSSEVGQTTTRIGITSVNDAPILDLDSDDSSGSTGNDYNTTFNAGGPAVSLADDITLTDVDSTIQTLAVSITNANDGTQEGMTSVGNANITTNYDPATSTLTLTNNGTATTADFEAILNTLSYWNTSTTPDTATRVVEFVVNDGIDDSQVATTYVAVNGDSVAPSMVNNLGNTVSEGAADVIQAAELSYSDDLQANSAVDFTITTGPTNGYLALLSAQSTPITSFTQADIDSGQLVFVHDGSETASDQFTFSVDDGLGNVLVGQVFNITVLPVNDAPTTSPVGLTAIAEDNVRIITQAELLANAADVEGDGLTANNLVIASGNGTLVDNLDGTWSYTSSVNDDSDVAFSYNVTDSTDSVAGSATLDILPVNDAPTTSPVGLTAIAEDNVRIITQAELLANAADVEGDGLTANNLVIASGNGTLVDNGDGTWSYTPSVNDDSDVAFSYNVTDSTDSVAGSATLDILPANDAPTNSAVTLTPTLEDNDRVVTEAELLANAIDVDGDSLSVANLTIASGNGNLVDNGDGTWTYVPAANDDSSVAFSYDVTDGAINVAGTATLDILPVNDAIANSTVTLSPVLEDNGRIITEAELLANASDLEGDALSVTGLAISSGNGTLVDNLDGTWSYTPAANDDSDVAFSYTVTDSTDSVVGSAVLDITPVNDAPTFTSPNLFIVNEGASLIGQLTSNDVDGGAPLFSLTGNGPDDSLFSIAPNGQISLNAPADFENNNSYSIEVQVDDGNGSKAIQLVTVEVINSNESPTLVSPSDATLSEGTNTTGGVSVATLSTTDPDLGDSFTYSIAGGPDASLFSIQGDQVIFDAGVLDFETDSQYSVIVEVEDSGGSTLQQTFTLNVTDVDEPLQVDQNQPVSVANQGEVQIGPADLSVIDQDTVPSDIVYVISQVPVSGQLLVNGIPIGAGGSFTQADVDSGMVAFRHSSGPQSVDGFVFDVTDGTSTITNQQFVVMIGNATPTATDDQFSADEDSVFTGNVVANDTDQEPGALTADLVSGPTNASQFNLLQDGTFSYMPSPDFFGTDSFSYQVTDSTGGTSTAVATIVVSPVNDIPVAIGESFSLSTDQAGVVLDVIANDADADQDALVAVILSQPKNGQLVTMADGKLSYTPNPGFVGTDQFTYAPSDLQTQGTLVTVELTVEPPVGVPSGGIPGSGDPQSPEPDDTSNVDEQNVDEQDLDLDNDDVSDGDEMEVDQTNTVEGLLPIQSIDRNDASGADTLANESTQGDLDGDIDFETFRDNLIASGMANQESAATSLLALSRIGYSSGLNEETITELGRYAIASVAYDAKMLWSQLDELETSFEAQFGDVSFSLGAVSAFGVAGYVLWTLRGGVLMAAALSQLPSWRMVDPLPLLDSYSNNRNDNDNADDVTGFFD